VVGAWARSTGFEGGPQGPPPSHPVLPIQALDSSWTQGHSADEGTMPDRWHHLHHALDTEPNSVLGGQVGMALRAGDVHELSMYENNLVDLRLGV
jgi:hypothetical protein